MKRLEIKDENKESMVTYVLEYFNEKIRISFETYETSNYFLSDGSVVNTPNKIPSIDLSVEDIILLGDALIRTSSDWFKKTNRDNNGEILSIDKEDLSLKVIKKTSGKQNRSTTGFVIEKKGIEIISFQFTKTKAFALLEAFRILISEFNEKIMLTKEDKNGFVYYIGKTKDVFVIREVCLRNKEIGFLRNFVELAIFNKHFETDKKYSFKKMKQVTIGEVADENRVEIKIVFSKGIDKEGIMITFTPELASILFLLLGENGVTNQNLVLGDNEEDAVLNTQGKIIEKASGAFLGFDVEKKQYNYQTERGMPLLTIYDPLNKDFNNLNLELKKQWSRFFAYIAKAYNANDSLEYNKNNFSFFKFYFKTIDNGLFYDVSISFISSVGSRNISMDIEKISVRTKEKTKTKVVIPHLTVGTLVRKIIETVSGINEFSFSLMHDKSPESFLRMKNKGNRGIFFHDSNVDFAEIKLNEKDRLMLYLSAKHRLLHGYWLSFRGENLSIDDDGYLTTIAREYYLEKDRLVQGNLNAIIFLALLGKNKGMV